MMKGFFCHVRRKKRWRKLLEMQQRQMNDGWLQLILTLARVIDSRVPYKNLVRFYE